MGCMADVRPVRAGDDRCTGSESTPAHDPQMPSGGVESGNTEEGPAYTVQEMTERRLVVLEP
jgi:hypothetical protein